MPSLSTPRVIAVALIATVAMPGIASAANTYPAADSGYHDYTETQQVLRDTEAAYPDIVRVFSIGESHQGRKIWVAEVSDRVGRDEGEPEIMLDGLHHAREHLTGEMSLYVLRLLTTNYGKTTTLGRRVTRIVDSRRIWIIPMVNPDGLQYDLGGDPYREWRKNRQPIPGSTKVGTDLNRNYDYAWSKGTSAPSSENYRGAAPFSAPETRAIRDFVLGRRTDGVQRIKAHISFHTAGEYVLWPYGYTTKDVPADMTTVDERALRTMGKRMAAMNGYRPRQSSDMYPTYGDQIDWMYGTQRIFSYTFEMYPRSGGANRHYPPDERIDKEVKRNRDAVLYLMEQADCPYRAIDKASALCGPLYDDLEIARGWRVDAAGTDTAKAGAWQRAKAEQSPRQLATTTSGRRVLVTGKAKGVDVDGGRTTVRSRKVKLPAKGQATLRLRYWVGMSASASPDDRFRVRLVRPSNGKVLATALTVAGTGTARTPAWKTLTYRIPASLRGKNVAIELVAVDAKPDATVEAGVDDVRITVAGS